MRPVKIDGELSDPIKYNDKHFLKKSNYFPKLNYGSLLFSFSFFFFFLRKKLNCGSKNVPKLIFIPI